MQPLDQIAICECFNSLFSERYRVVLRGGGAEPEYLPASGDHSEQLGQIVAREDFPASALHEAAHWCVADRARRALADYGYEYLPPPRGAAQQAEFFRLELRAQATELYLARRAGVTFRASADDPDFCLQTLAEFGREVYQLADHWGSCVGRGAVPPRARHFAQALAQRSGWAG